MNEPTQRQLQVLRAIEKAAAEGLPPTLRELGDELGIASLNAVNDHLVALRRKGLLENRPFRSSRALRITKAGLRRLGRAHG
jgi:repressor LexA